MCRVSRLGTGIACLAFLAQPGPAQAQLDLSAQLGLLELFELATPIVDDFATAVCQETDTTRTVDRADLRVELEARLPGVLGRLADLGGGIEGGLERNEAVGVLAEDLADLLVQQRQCRERVTDALLERLVPLRSGADPAAAPAPPPATPGANPEAFVAFTAPEPIEVETWEVSKIRDGRSETVTYGERRWFRLGLIKQTHLPLENCDFLIELVGPSEWVAAYETWEGPVQRGAISLDGRKRALQTPGPTRIGLEAGIGIPDTETPPARVNMEVILDCSNYGSPSIVLGFPIAP